MTSDQPARDPAPAETLRPAAPADVGLSPGPIDQISAHVAAGTQPQGSANRPLFPGAVVLVGHHGRIVKKEAFGYAVLHPDAMPTLLPPEQRVPTSPDTIYDLASLTKLFTSVVAMTLVDQGRLELAAPVAAYLPAFASHGKSGITVEQLLTHTSGYDPIRRLRCGICPMTSVPALCSTPSRGRRPACATTTRRRPRRERLGVRRSGRSRRGVLRRR